MRPAKNPEAKGNPDENSHNVVGLSDVGHRWQIKVRSTMAREGAAATNRCKMYNDKLQDFEQTWRCRKIDYRHSYAEARLYFCTLFMRVPISVRSSPSRARPREERSACVSAATST